jgi:hypothetical protein
MDANTARGLINQILYGIDRVPDLTADDAVSACADSLINQRHFRHPVEEYAEAISHALHEGGVPAQAVESSRRYSAPDLLDFLTRLARRLDERRPWPDPAFRKLDPDEWSTFANATPVARINRPTHQVTGILHNSFDEVPVGAEKLPVMILRLPTGDVVALMGSLDSRSRTFTLLQRDDGDPTNVIERFREVTGFAPDDIVPIAGSR